MSIPAQANKRCPDGWVRASLAPRWGADDDGASLPRGIGRLRLPPPRAMVFRPVGPVSRAPNGGAVLRTMAFRPVGLVPGHAPNGGKESSPGMSVAIPREHTPQNPLHPNGVRECSGALTSVDSVASPPILAPRWGAGLGGMSFSRGIGRLRLPHPRAIIFRPVGPVLERGMRSHRVAHPQTTAFLPDGPFCRAPNRGRESSPGMSVAIPWEPSSKNPMHPNGVREMN